MKDIICPHCKKVFKVDEAGFADILKQVRDGQFEKELHERLEAAIKIAEAEKDKQRIEEIAKKDKELMELKSQISNNESVKKLALTQAVNLVEKERDDLRNKLQIKDQEIKLREIALKERYENELKTKDDIIKIKDEELVFRKDMKLKLSTKMIGESLEQHCEIEFNKLRATAFQNAYFEKDNDAQSGSKGDYIYRETTRDGVEIISIMFEMKNEGDETATKKRNEDFLKELDKDRTEKKCEYAVLVSLLEADNELYNTGIVDVSYRYPKMYVIRPQFFIPLITLLRNAAMNSLKFKTELALVRSQNIDITNFENELRFFQEGFMKNVKDSSNKFQEAMDGIDATIKKLESIKEALRLSNKHLLTAGSKIESVSVKRLIKDNPTMTSKFAELSNKKDKKIN